MSSRNEENGNGSGAELRRDLRGDYVIVSPGRAARPYDFREGSEDRRSRCPFCPGREARTPPEVDAVRSEGSAANGPGWRVRVVPNRYPAFPPTPGEGSAWGLHEVIVESPDHERGVADLPAEDVEVVLRVFQRRLKAARADGRIRFASIFKNHGPEAGASIEHPHAQMMAVPFVPRRIAEELQAHERGEFAWRLAAADPVATVGDMTAFCPEDARMPHEIWIAPRRREATFEDASTAVVRETAGLLRSILGAMNAILGRPPYHLLLYTAPFQGGEAFTWRIEVVPRLVRIAGFELATGVFVNQTAPEKVTADYRAALDA